MSPTPHYWPFGYCHSLLPFFIATCYFPLPVAFPIAIAIWPFGLLPFFYTKCFVRHAYPALAICRCHLPTPCAFCHCRLPFAVTVRHCHFRLPLTLFATSKAIYFETCMSHADNEQAGLSRGRRKQLINTPKDRMPSLRGMAMCESLALSRTRNEYTWGVLQGQHCCVIIPKQGVPSLARRVMYSQQVGCRDLASDPWASYLRLFKREAHRASYPLVVRFAYLSIASYLLYT